MIFHNNRSFHFILLLYMFIVLCFVKDRLYWFDYFKNAWDYGIAGNWDPKLILRHSNIAQSRLGAGWASVLMQTWLEYQDPLRESPGWFIRRLEGGDGATMSRHPHSKSSAYPDKWDPEPCDQWPGLREYRDKTAGRLGCGTTLKVFMVKLVP